MYKVILDQPELWLSTSEEVAQIVRLISQSAANKDDNRNNADNTVWTEIKIS